MAEKSVETLLAEIQGKTDLIHVELQAMRDLSTVQLKTMNDRMNDIAQANREVDGKMEKIIPQIALHDNEIASGKFWVRAIGVSVITILTSGLAIAVVWIIQHAK